MDRSLSKLAALAAVAVLACACASTPVEAPVHRDRVARLGADGGPQIVTLAKPISCVPFARQRSGIAIYGDAYTWWDQAHGRYAEYDTPRVGSVMVLIGYAGPKHGHLAVVRRIVSDREIRVDHANWLNDGNLYLNTPVVDVSDDNDWSAVRVWNPRDNRLGTGTYHVQGFIAPTAVATRGARDES